MEDNCSIVVKFVGDIAGHEITVSHREMLLGSGLLLSILASVVPETANHYPAALG